ncbi:hypothetical protein FB567DRAFT_32882 [Paraphoma chrysanthemicola]|uniref:Uncharacterized protein n=1 Tax=Paraphoma chrysanthemicola TaxID=798071 RepID=A0A8K0W4Q0_9PLEO|nr:hypothetical protein FB567DRAFT_32882 [Paraphoma chrysanthemicola]
MALSNITAGHVIAAMKPDVAPRNSNPLKNKVVHADIRVSGIDDDVGQSPEGNGASVQLIKQPTTEDAEDQERAEEMQTWWNNEMKKHMNQPDGYAKVAVLLIKWADELDELKTKNEAAELDALFRERFNYLTQTVELNVRKKPQHQLNSHISDFIRDHDGPHNLLIIYYTGHGVFKEDKKYLELTATTNPAVSKGFSRDAKANWNKVEEKLKDDEVEGDVLTILDTCYASNVAKKSGKPETKKFELLSACPIDQTTAAPGKYSFTRALIDGLKELLAEHKDPVSTFRIQQRINLNDRRSDSPAQLWSRSPTSEHHIFLAPLKLHKPDITQPSSFRHTPGGFLTLRFGLRDASLNKEQIEYMTKTLANALFNKALIGLRKVEWLEMHAAPPIPHFDRVALVMFAVTQWKKVISHRREERESQLASQRSVDHVRLPGAVEGFVGAAQKRGREDGGGDEAPGSKRRYLDAMGAHDEAHPPSPPVSTSSRGD